MKKTTGGFRNVAQYLLLCIVLAETTVVAQRKQRSFSVEETTIAQIHAAMRDHRLTCRALVDAYLKRIDAYDKRGPAINALVVLNPNATKEADELDRRFAQGGLTGPLHCIPAIVKDNFETIGLQSADGSLSLGGFISNKDAFQVRRIKAAGAIVLAKSNMAEFAFSLTRRLIRSYRATRATRTRSIASRQDRAAAPRRRSPQTSAPSASAVTLETRFGGRRLIKRWLESDRRWG